MGIFKKNPNETAYVGGKKHWIDVIKNTGPENYLIWRQPEEDFNTNSTLIVMPGEKAVFVSQGEIEAIFEEPGTYKLSTQNYPFITRLMTMFSGGISTFNCVVFFVKDTSSQEILWGTSSPIQVRDKVWGIRTDARARGSYKIKVDRPEVFMTKLIGSNISFETPEGMDRFFSNEFQVKIKTVLSRFLNGYDNELIGIDAQIESLSAHLKPQMDEILAPYGLSCLQFTISGLDIDNSKYDIIDESQIGLIEERRKAMAKKQEIEILGEDWTRVTGKEVLMNMSGQPGTGNMMGAGLGLGAGMELGGIAGKVMYETFKPVEGNKPGPESRREETADPFNTDRFEVVEETPAVKEEEKTEKGKSPMEILEELKKWHDMELISDEEYEMKRKEVLSRL